MLDMEDLIFNTRALAQSHPFTSRAYAYLNEMVARERTSQPIPELGIWAGQCLTYGYCLRSVEEEDAGRRLTQAPEPLPQDLDEAATHIAAAIRTEGSEPYLIYPEERVVEGLDHLIAGEIDRRLTHWQDTIDQETWDEIQEYIAWWVIKGYALRVAEQMLPEDEAQVQPAEPG